MDSSAHITALIDQLDDNVDNLQDALKLILSSSLSDIAANYPVLDRAKLYILVTYAIESAIFSFLRLTGTSAREHPVFRELERVKQYFAKTKLAETTVQKPSMRLDQAAAGRFIKAALASNNIAPIKDQTVVEQTAAINLDSTVDAGVKKSKKRKSEALEQPAEVVTTWTGKTTETNSDPEQLNADDSAMVTESSNVTSAVATPSKATGTITPSEGLTDAEKKAEKKREAKKRKKAAKRAREAAQASDPISATEANPVKKKQKRNTDRGAKDNDDASSND